MSPTYRAFVGEARWTGWDHVPYLPVEAFKWTGIVGFDEKDSAAVFLSSATGGRRSRHPIHDLSVYEAVSVEAFKRAVETRPCRFLAHLPSYQATGSQSSLIYMVETLMHQCGRPDSVFLPEETSLRQAIEAERGTKTSSHSHVLIVFGTAFGLLDITENDPLPLPPGSLVIETGGMKTRRRDIDRGELHASLASGFAIPRTAVRSEYGMCEMLSQCYTDGDVVFRAPPWVRFRILDLDDPNRPLEQGMIGQLAIFDLANVHSVSALLTSDLARQRGNGFEVVGRLEGAELRGCNFLFGYDI